MLTFKEYFLQETIVSNISFSSKENPSVISGIKASALGLVTSVSEELPEKLPYGFWVDKHGNYKALIGYNSGGHITGAQEILAAARNYLESEGKLTDKKKEGFKEALSGFKKPYEALYNAGYMHIVMAGKTFHFKAYNISPPQWKFLTRLEQAYIQYDVDTLRDHM